MLDLESEVNTKGGVTFCHWNVLFSRSEASDANIGTLPFLCISKKTLLEDPTVRGDTGKLSIVFSRA